MQITGNHKTRKICIDGVELSPVRSQVVWNHSPDGWNWSYGGLGPSQLALGLLLEFGLDDATATKHHQDFKWKVIAKLPRNDFELDGSEIEAWIEENVE